MTEDLDSLDSSEKNKIQHVWLTLIMTKIRVKSKGSEITLKIA